MLIFKTNELKMMTTDNSSVVIDQAISELIHADLNPDARFNPNIPRIAIHGRDSYLSVKEGKNVFGLIGYDLVALKYLWSLHKKAIKAA